LPARVRDHDAGPGRHPGGLDHPRLVRLGKSTAVGAGTAIVVGLVAITPAAGFISPMNGLILGLIAAVPSYSR
jgi:ammonia channel protein AmtB